ncbi:MAG: hypothetical protein AAF291_05650 [Pseudomonadota bacterium]
MNGITSTGQDPGTNRGPDLPPSGFETLNRLDDGFGAPPPEMTRSEWLEMARNSANPDMQAFYTELVTLAGGRTDDAALNQVIDRYQALQNAGTASEVAAAQRGMIDQVASMLNRFDPVDRLLDAAQPQLAQWTQQAGLGETEWGASLQSVLDVTGSLGAFRDGLRTGMLNGAKDMVVGTLELAGRTLQYGADSSLSGFAGDWLRDQVGELPGFLDEVVPSAERGAATSETLANMRDAIGGYIGSIVDDPSKLRRDVVSAIEGQWDTLKASHDAAAAQGSEAQAQWWGETIGRITFEVAATFVPVAGQAGKGARIADTAGDLADVAADAGRIVTRSGDEAADALRAADAATDVADPAMDAARAARAGQSIDHTFGGNTVRYTYDAQGRLQSARAELSEVFSGLDRSNAEVQAQRDVARRGVDGDQGGHAVGHRFLSDQGERGMFPQNGTPVDTVIDGEMVRLRNLNSGAFARLENEIADWIRAGGTVDYQIEFFDFDGVRPSRIQVSYEVMGPDGDVVFDNVKEFANEAGQSFDRVRSADMAQYFE